MTEINQFGILFKKQAAMRRRFRFTIAIKHLILLGGIVFAGLMIKGLDAAVPKGLTGLGIAAAGCFIAYALIENNDVRESNKE
jgi:hypothetical protein